MKTVKTDRTNAFKQILLETEIDKNGSVLDVGCGNGESTFVLAQKIERVIGVDTENLQEGKSLFSNRPRRISYFFLYHLILFSFVNQSPFNKRGECCHIMV